MNRDQVRCAAEKYLGSRHTTLWSNWDLTSPDRRDQAVRDREARQADVAKQKAARRAQLEAGIARSLEEAA